MATADPKAPTADVPADTEMPEQALAHVFAPWVREPCCEPAGRGPYA